MRFKAPQRLSIKTWEGPSEYNGKQIISVLTGLGRVPSLNVKTGPMIQHWVMESDKTPLESVKTNSNDSVCGDCPLKPQNKEKNGLNSCYVNTARRSSTHKSISSKEVTKHSKTLEYIKNTNRNIRLGSWGDPAMLPFEEVNALAIAAKGHTGYTHQWKVCDQRFKNILMASVESEKDEKLAKSMGWRTFRVLKKSEEPSPNDVMCPASKEANNPFVTCDSCMLCGGNAKHAKSVFIYTH